MQKHDIPPDCEDAFERIHNSGTSLLGIINDILDMSKIESGKLELHPVEYDVPSLINDAVQLNIVRIGSKPIEFVLELNKSLPSKLYGDELRLKQILNNLLSNAIKYTASGSVKLAINHMEQDGGVTLLLAVSDTGQGMTPEGLEKLFSSYERLNEEGNRSIEGTGLGLNITKTLVDMMDGTIEVASEYGKGSTFTVTVKQGYVECEAIGEELAERLGNFKFAGNKKSEQAKISRALMPYGRVLVVDDVETNLHVAQGMLAPYELAIELASSGFAVIEKVECGMVYDVIFMDHMMPLMDGVETTKKLRAMGYEGPIIALTANAIAGNAEMFKANGFDDFIPKPIDIQQMNACLNTYVRERHPEEAKKYPTKEMLLEMEQSRASKELLAVFCRDAGKSTSVLRKTSVNGDTKLFTTTAHAMKSALANIGEQKLSEKAAALEKAGREGDNDYIMENTEWFTMMLETLVARVAPPENDEGDPEGQNGHEVDEDTAFLAEQLQSIKKACENFDDTEAYAALNNLKGKTWKKETIQRLNEIYDTLFLNSDFEKVVQLIDSVEKEGVN
jgi:CheY-like chemotaxis protein